MSSKENNWRHNLFQCIEVTKDKKLNWYDVFMLIVIIASIIPLCFQRETLLLIWLDRITTSIFIVDYILRWITSDFRCNEKSFKPFLKYPFTLAAIIDLLAILPSLILINKTFALLKLFRIARTFKILRIGKFARYSKQLSILLDVFQNAKGKLLTVGTLALSYVFISALIIFNVEPDTFKNFFDAFYWAVVSLTTVGYGDIYPTSTVGRIVAMVSSVFGIAIVALPSGIITAEYMNAINQFKDE